MAHGKWSQKSHHFLLHTARKHISLCTSREAFNRNLKHLKKKKKRKLSFVKRKKKSVSEGETNLKKNNVL